MSLPFLLNAYYQIKPIIPRRLQILLRKRLLAKKITDHANKWPIDPDSASPPDNWEGWPEGKRFAVVLTHDVEKQKGYNSCRALMEIDQKIGFRSSFNFVPERDYKVETKVLHYLADNGFEIGVHDLNHDGKLYKSEKIFRDKAGKINSYLQEWNSVGFRSGAMHRHFEWLNDLNIEYDASSFDTDPFEPNPKGMTTIFPFLVKNPQKKPYVELPYTLAQDSTLFIIMAIDNIDIWTKKLDWIVQHGGMALLNTHPDYMNFSGRNIRFDEYPSRFYSDFLEYINSKYGGQYWNPLPKEMARFFLQRDI